MDVHDLDTKINDLYYDNKWHLEKVYTTLPNDLQMAITNTQLFLNLQVQDSIIWGGCTDGTYSAKEGYKWLTKHRGVGDLPGTWSWIWKLEAPKKIKFLLWLECHGSSLTMQVLHHRHVAPSNSCQRCNNVEESFVHCVRDCFFPQQLWRMLGFMDPSFYSQQDAIAWIKGHLKSDKAHLFLAGLWCSWTARNKACIAQEFVNIHQLVREARSFAATLAIAFRAHMSECHSPRCICWHPTREEGAILNVDGSFLDCRGRAGFGGLVQTEDGVWQIGFCGFLGAVDVLKVELVAILQGLSIAWALGARKLITYSDSLMVVSLVSQEVNPLHKYALVISNIREMIHRPWTIRLFHTLREGNFAADALAKRGVFQEEPLCVFDVPPLELRSVLLADAMRVPFLRGMT